MTDGRRRYGHRFSECLAAIRGDPLAPAWYMIGAGVVGLVAITPVPETAPVKRARLAPMAEAGTLSTSP